jgi:chorismate mutase
LAEEKTIKVSVENHTKLYTCSKQLEKILHKKQVTPDQVISVLFNTTRLDDYLIQMALEEAELH